MEAYALLLYDCPEMLAVEKEDRARKFSGETKARNLLRGFGGLRPPEADALLKAMYHISNVLGKFFLLLSYNFTEMFPLEKVIRAMKFSSET